MMFDYGKGNMLILGSDIVWTQIDLGFVILFLE